MAFTATPGSRLDLPAGRKQSLLTDSMRAVASDAILSNSASQAPLRATCSKSQPPHLVFEYIYYCHQNLSSDHLLSGVSPDYRKTRCLVNRISEYRGRQHFCKKSRLVQKLTGRLHCGVAGTEIRTSSGVVQVAFPAVSCRRFMVTFSD